MSVLTIDVKNPVELRAAGIRALNTTLGVDVAQAFMKQCFGGRGDYTKEKYDKPDMTPKEFTAMMEAAKNEAIKAGTWE